jgi:F-type H+-transporting ATPase subunit delta
MSNETVARRYATALADVVVKAGDSNTVKTELAAWSETFAVNNDLREVMGNPAIPHSSKERVLDEMLKKVKPSKTTSNFLRVMLQNGRLTDITGVNERFAAILAERSGIVKAEVISARELPASEKKQFETSLEKLTGKDMQITFTVDPNIIGGVVTRVGSTVYDGSVRTKLDNLKEQLSGI